jgi:RHS repeat-associated protein
MQQRTVFNWCYCGALQDLCDPAGNRTRWDIGGRLIAKQFPDGSTHSYTYDLAGRLVCSTGAENQTRQIEYAPDNQVTQISYLNARVATLAVSFKYDPVYGRLQEMQDGSGVTRRHPAGNPGAGRLASVDGPLPEDTVAYTYDGFGRVTQRSIHTDAVRIESCDAVDRCKVNALGRFTYTYNPQLQMETVQAPNGVPNGVQTRFEYQTAAGRLPQITHRSLASATGAYSATHQYTQSAGGEITGWNQTVTEPRQTPTENWSLEYDGAGQLVAAARQDGLQESWAYDPAGNRIRQQRGAGVSRGVFNGLNQLLRCEGGGQVLFSGTTNEAATVRVRNNQGPELPAQVRQNHRFRAWVPVEPGRNTVRITARDGAGNERSQTYELEVPAVAPRVFTYDKNGNTDGRRGYTWDAENRLSQIMYADGTTTQIGYDGFGRRVRVEEKHGQGAVTSIRRYVWAGGTQPAEERDATRVVRRFFEEGEQVVGGPGEATGLLYYARDHLGTVREVTDSSGRLVCRVEYDFWGAVKRRSTWDFMGNRQESPAVTVAGYTGHHEHAKSGLVLTWHRAYDPETGRWLSRDPIAEEGGINLYGYVFNDPINLIDPNGFQPGSYHLPNWGYPSPANPPTSPEEAAGRCIGSSNYREASLLTSPNWQGKPKCNKFVGDMISLCPNMPKPLVNGRYPRAIDWMDPNVSIPGFGPPHLNPQSGDVLSDGAHCGIKTPNGVIQAPPWAPVYEASPDKFDAPLGRTPLK